MNYAQYGLGSKLKNKIGTPVITDISCYLKGPTNKLKYVTVLFTKITRYTERILAVSPEILHTERDELASFQQMCCVT